MNKCSACGSEIKPTKIKCSVCQYKEAQEKITTVSIRCYDYHVIIDALEFAYSNYRDGEKQKEFKEVLSNWNELSKNFDSVSIT